MSKKVLYITANFTNALLVKRLVNSEGHHFLNAPTPQEGHELARQEHPDLIILNGHSPNGFDESTLHYLQSPTDIAQLTALLRQRLNTPTSNTQTPLTTAITQTTYL